MKVVHTSGQRKTAKARATLSQGTGIVRVNSKLLEFVPWPSMYRLKVQEPLVLAGESAKKVNIKVNVHGGGINSQADAVRLAVAKALAQYDRRLQKEFLDYDRTLLIADVRRKEEHKPNCHGKARAKRQKSYR